MKKTWLYICLISLIASSAYAQDQSRLNQAIATLEAYTAQIPQLISKTVRCARGVESCTQAEITQARTAIGVIGAALAVVAIGITAGTTAKVKGWRPFKRKPTSLIIEATPMQQPIVALVEMTDEEIDAKRQAIYNLSFLMAPSEDLLPGTIGRQDAQVIRNAVEILNRLIQENKVSPTELVPGQEFTIQDMLNSV